MQLFPAGLGVTLAMMFTMAVGSSAILAVAVSAPDSFPDIGISDSYVGIFTGFVYFVSMFFGSFCTRFITRYGPIRILQISAIASTLGLSFFTLATPTATILCAIFLGIAYGPINPSHAPVLLRVSHSGNRGVFFSIKQSGVTVGGAAAAVIVPYIAVLWNWQAGIFAIALMGIISILMLQPMRDEFDRDRTKINLTWSFSQLVQPVIDVFKNPLLRGFALVGFTYAGVQVSVGSYFVVYLVTREFSLVDAGICFLFVNIGGVIGRVAWGGLSDKWLTPKYTLTLIGVVSAVSLCGMYLVSDSWNVFLLYVFSFVVGASTHGWNGIFLAEIADHAPAGESHNWTAGVQFVIYAGVAVMPPLFGGIIFATGNYSIAFFMIAAFALIASAALIWLYRVYPGYR